MLKSIVFGLCVLGFCSVVNAQGYPVQWPQQALGQQQVATQQVQVNEFNGVQQQAPVAFNGATIRRPDVFHYHEHHVVNNQPQYSIQQQYYVPQQTQWYYPSYTQGYYPQQQYYQPQYYYYPQRSWWCW